MYIAKGIQNNNLYVELRIRSTDKVKIYLDDNLVTVGKNEKGGNVVPHEDKTWDAGRYVFHAFDGPHTLTFSFYDGETGETVDVPPQSVALQHSFNCVILDQARMGVWRAEPNEYFGRKTHARFVVDGSYIDPEDTEDKPEAKAPKAPEAQSAPETPAETIPEKTDRKAERQAERQAKKEEAARERDLYQRTPMTLIAIIMGALVLLFVALFFILSAVTKPAEITAPEREWPEETAQAAVDAEQAETFLQGVWTHFVTEDEIGQSLNGRVSIVEYSFDKGTVREATGEFEEVLPDSGAAGEYLIHDKPYIMMGGGSREGTYEIRLLSDGRFDVQINLPQNTQYGAARSFRLTVTADPDDPDRFTVASTDGTALLYERWSFQDNRI